jgi:exodeoxyribonuclease VII large subunit
MRRELRIGRSRLDAVGHRLSLGHPGVRLQQQEQRLDDLTQRLCGATRACLHREGQRLAEERARLQRYSPQHVLAQWTARNESLQLRLARAMRELTATATRRGGELQARLERAASQCVPRLAQRLALAQRALDAVSPLATLARGFAIVKRADGSVLTDAAAVEVGEEIEATLASGKLTARVTRNK